MEAGHRVWSGIAAAVEATAAVRADEPPVEATAVETAAAVKAASTSREGRARGEDHETDDRECSEQTGNFELLHDSTPFGRSADRKAEIVPAPGPKKPVARRHGARPPWRSGFDPFLVCLPGPPRPAAPGRATPGLSYAESGGRRRSP
jgi:hypothetical protein